MSYRRLRAMFVKELLHITRDSRSLAMALAMPMMMLLLYGYALSLDVDHIQTLIYDQDGTATSRALTRQFVGSRYFQVLGFAKDYREIESGIDKSRILIGIAIPRGFGSDVAAGEAKVQLLVDGSDSNTASIAMGYAESVVQSYSAEVRAEVLNRRGMKPPGTIDARARVWYNSSLQSKNFVVPGLVGVILMILAGQLTSLTVAREWEMGNHGAGAVHAAAAGGNRARQDAGVFRGGPGGRGAFHHRGDHHLCSAVPRQLLRIGGFHVRVFVVRAVFGNLDFRRSAQPGAGVPVGHVDFVSARLPAFRLHVFD